MFPSFSRTGADVWIDRTRRAILENTLFCVAVEDNEWSVAVELLQEELVSAAIFQILSVRYGEMPAGGSARHRDIYRTLDIRENQAGGRRPPVTRMLPRGLTTKGRFLGSNGIRGMLEYMMTKI